MTLSLIKKSQLYFIFSFLATIAVGTPLLKLPGMWRGETPLAWSDALFTATTTVTTTGLMTVKFTDYTFPGQVVVLVLIQIGGLGIMGLSASIMLMLSKKFSYADTLMLSTISDNFAVRRTEGMLRFITIYTLYCECAGFVILFPAFLWGGTPWLEALWRALFLAVSGFCHAGISHFGGESMIGQPIAVKLTVAALIIAGSLGFYCVYDLYLHRQRRTRLSAQTVIVLFTTAILLFGGMILIWSIQYVEKQPIGWLDAFFQSTTARSAGFTSVNMGEMAGGSVALMIVLMVIGSAPGSTGGGVRVTSAALATLAIFNTFQGNPRVLIRHREIPLSNVMKAFVLILTLLTLVALGTVLIQALSDCDSEWAFFHTVSALTTTGLELRPPEGLTASAKLVLIAFMFIGRVGLFTFFLFLLDRERRSRLIYPKELIVVN